MARPAGSFRVALLEKRGKFTVARPIFEPGDQVSFDRKVRYQPAQIILAEIRGGRARFVKDLGRIDNARDVCEALAAERLGRRGFSPKLESLAASRQGIISNICVVLEDSEVRVISKCLSQCCRLTCSWRSQKSYVTLSMLFDY